MPQNRLRCVAILLEIGPGKPEDPVFNLAKHNVRAAFDAAKRRARRAHTRDCKNAGKAPDPKFLANLRFHDLRAEGVTTMLEAGLTPAEVMEFSGHKTMHVFLGYTRFRKLELARKLSERNEGGKSGS